MTMICSFCKTKYPSDYKWCMEDGNALESDTGQHESDAAIADGSFVGAGASGVCPDCGTPYGEGDTFCGGCGGSLAAQAPAAGAAAAGAPAGGTVCPDCGTPYTEGDVFCGGCGGNLTAKAAAPALPSLQAPAALPIAPPAMAGPLSAPAMDASAAIQALCPSCGMEIAPGDTFCGTCGHPIEAAAPALVAAAPEPAPAPAAPVAKAQTAPAPAPAVAVCPSCGMDVVPGETFCGTCGHPLSSVAPPPMAAKVVPPTCPNCGMDIDPGQKVCGTCGSTLDSALGATPPTIHALGISSITEDIPVCPVCGIENMAGATHCSACNSPLGGDEEAEPVIDLGAPMPAPKAAAPAPKPAAPVAASAPAPAPAAAPAGAEKICSCCGTANPVDVVFCGNCGVDFE